MRNFAANGRRRWDCRTLPIPCGRCCGNARSARTPEPGSIRSSRRPRSRPLAGKTVRAKGFTLPLDGSDQTTHFLIGVNTPVCFYHPPGEPNEVIEVTSKQPVAWNDKLTTVEGTFSLINNGELGVFFRLTNAHQVRT
ncbi:MAG: DUF3299 domain-containing protein [Asticcacaulis sp.]